MEQRLALEQKNNRLYDGNFTQAVVRHQHKTAKDRKDDPATAVSPNGNLTRPAEKDGPKYPKPEDIEGFGWNLIPMEAEAEMQLEPGLVTARALSPSEVALRVDVKGLSSHGAVNLENLGEPNVESDGNHATGAIRLKKGLTYQLKFLAKVEGKLDTLHIALPKQEGAALAEAEVRIDPKHPWKEYEIYFLPAEDYDKGRLCILMRQTGTLWLADVRLNPVLKLKAETTYSGITQSR